MSGYFIEPDGHDELTLWRATSDVRGPEPVARRCDVGEEAWGLLVAQVESPSAPVPAVPLTDALAPLEALLSWPVGRDTGGIERMVPSTDLRRAIDEARDALAARAAAQPPAADRDADARACPHDELLIDPCEECSWDADDGYEVGERFADLDAAARPAPDAVPADRVRALEEALSASEVERDDLDTAVGTLVGENVGLEAAIEALTGRVRALAEELIREAEWIEGDEPDTSVAQARTRRLIASRLRALLADHQPAGIHAAVERSSFGTPEAKAARASVSDEQVAKVMDRVRELEAAGADHRPAEREEGDRG